MYLYDSFLSDSGLLLSTLEEQGQAILVSAILPIPCQLSSWIMVRGPDLGRSWSLASSSAGEMGGFCG